ncbi:hypothetical protein [Mesorhizobium sp. STM 4661]|uniref:hypothetical protein n=1 Tax=Mesorhizobium sp. STM 4661 TaxID=1297570 RepID=UPI0002BFDBAD|nr:hypothetical protein [Mesorhizobium sp. STM 4661]CCV12938.1 hypothetical protein MESS4_510105 [Mesorhizobium sp. STM 4661]
MAGKSKILIKFRIGKNSGSRDASGTGAAEAITNAVADESGRLARERTLINLKGLNGRLQRVIETEYAQGVKYAAENMMGQMSVATAPKVFSFADAGFNARSVANTKRFQMQTQPFARGQITWAPLHRSTIRRKIEGGLSIDRAKRFYRNTGRLRQELLSKAREMVKRTGVVKITFNDSGRFAPVKNRNAIIPVGRLRITLLPRTPRSALPGLLSGNLGDTNNNMSFEKSLGMSEDAITKLRGPMNGTYNLANRPLLQPVFTYWSLFRIPNKIAAALDASITTAVRGDGGYTEFGAGGK